MTVAQFIPAYMATGALSASAETPKALLKKFARVKQEDVTQLGNDTLLALEFNTTWQEIKAFAHKHKPQA